MKPLPTELAAKIDEIKSWMFDGDQEKVAAKSRKSREWVCKVLNKRVSPNIDILKAAVQVMNENKANLGIHDNQSSF